MWFAVLEVHGAEMVEKADENDDEQDGHESDRKQCDPKGRRE